MKRIYLISTILLLTISMGFTTALDWHLFETTDFSIEFPKKPETKNQVVNTTVGEMSMKMTIYDASADEEENLVYGIIVSAYPENMISSDKKDMLDGFFRSSIDGAVKNVNVKLLTEKIIQLDGYPGRETKVDYQNGLAIIKMRMYLVKNKMIILQTITTTAKDENKNSLQFMNSFKLKK